jgi:predicted ribosomally synthesized peptide with nif11-like leader
MIKNNNGAEAFLKQVRRDMKLRQQLDQITSTGRERSIEIALIANANGYEFTPDEYEKALANSTQKAPKISDKKECTPSGCMN